MNRSDVIKNRVDRPFIYRVEAVTDDGRHIPLGEEKNADRAHKLIDVYIEKHDPKERLSYRILEATEYLVIPSRAVRKESLRVLRAEELAKKKPSGALRSSVYPKLPS